MEFVDEVLFVPAIEVTSSPFNIRDTLKKYIYGPFYKIHFGAIMRCIFQLTSIRYNHFCWNYHIAFGDSIDRNWFFQELSL